MVLDSWVRNSLERSCEHVQKLVTGWQVYSHICSIQDRKILGLYWTDAVFVAAISVVWLKCNL